jgi:hypothetical protein
MKKSISAIWLFFGLSLFAYAQNSAKTNFGNYPYELAYWNLAYKSQAPTIKKLFGADAPFVTQIQGIPSSVTLESASGNKSVFMATLLLTIKHPDTGKEIKFARMQVRFQSDDMAEKTYVRYVKFVNLMSGEISEKQSHGSAMEDSNIAGFFFGMMPMFWDTTKL